jgi:hypothetical protein
MRRTPICVSRKDNMKTFGLLLVVTALAVAGLTGTAGAASKSTKVSTVNNAASLATNAASSSVVSTVQHTSRAAMNVQAASPAVLVRTAGVSDCVWAMLGTGVAFVPGVNAWTAVNLVLSWAPTVRGCGQWMAGAICRGSYFWGPAGWPFREFVKRATGGQYNHC